MYSCGVIFLCCNIVNTILDVSVVHNNAVLIYYRCVVNHMKYLCDGEEKGGGFVPRDKLGVVASFESVLLKLSKSSNPELVTASLGLLTDMYFFEEDLFKIADQVQ